MTPPPKSVVEWVRYLHQAAAIPKGSADYGAAQEAVQFALQRIANLNTAANVADQEALRGAPEKRTLNQRLQDRVTAMGVGLMHGYPLGA